MLPSTVYGRIAWRTPSSWIVSANSDTVFAPLVCMLMMALPISLRWAGVVHTLFNARMVSIHSMAQARSLRVARNCSGQKARLSPSPATV